MDLLQTCNQHVICSDQIQGMTELGNKLNHDRIITPIHVIFSFAKCGVMLWICTRNIMVYHTINFLD